MTSRHETPRADQAMYRANARAPESGVARDGAG
jgi:hypothetical protein